MAALCDGYMHRDAVYARPDGQNTLNLFCLILSFLFLVVTLPVGAATSYTYSQALLKKLEKKAAILEGRRSEHVDSRAVSDQEATIGVIVTIDALRKRVLDALPEQQRQYLERPEYLRMVQKNMLAQLRSQDIGNIKKYMRVPQVALRVNRVALRALVNNPHVTVSEDKPYRLFLDSSVPIVFPGQAGSSYTGDGWAVAVVDSGIDKSHTDLQDKVIDEACFSTNDLTALAPVSSLCPGGAESSTASGSGQACDITIDPDCDHGTRVAGIISSSHSTYGGVAAAASIISIQVASQVDDSLMFGDCEGELSCIRVYPSDVIEALEHVYSMRNSQSIAAVNLSLGQGAESGYCDTQPEAEIIQQLRSSKIAVVAAAGDSGYTSQIAVPACIEAAVAVGASSDADAHFGDSNVSTALDLYAPGEDITSLIPGGDFSSGNGTSMSAPHVAAAFAVMKHRAPWLSVSAIESLFKANGPEITASLVTRRRLDIDGALADVEDLDPDLMFPIRTKNGKTVVIYL